MNITLYVTQELTTQYMSKARMTVNFQSNYKCNLYYMDISEADSDKHCYFNTLKEGNTTFFILDQKRAEAV